MNAVDKIKEKAKTKARKVVLPEGTESRVVKAAEQIISEKLASVTLVGDRKEIERAAKETGADISGAELVEPTSSPLFDTYVAEFVEMRKKKGITEAQARELLANNLYFGAMLVKHDLCRRLGSR